MGRNDCNKGMRYVTKGRCGRDARVRESLVENDGILRQRTNLLPVLVEDERNRNEDDCESSEKSCGSWCAEFRVHLVREEWETCLKRRNRENTANAPE